MPDFKPNKDHHYIRLEDEWKEALTLNFEIELGQASRFRFCRPQGVCQDLEPRQHSDQVTLSANIDPASFGTCSLTLFGIRSRLYHFTVLALTDLKAELQPLQKAHFPEYQVQRRGYHTYCIRSANMTELGLQVAVVFDSSFMRIESKAQSCNPKSGECRTEAVEYLPAHGISTRMDLSVSSNLTLLVKLLPEQSTVRESLTTIYSVSVSVVNIAEELEKLGMEISKLQAQTDSMQDFDATASNEDSKRLEAIIEQRDAILRQTYDEKEFSETEYSTRLTLLAVGLTGTGKSELCRWMTGNMDKCTPSSSTTSNTSEVMRVPSRPFADPKMSPQMEWIDTPGRGDTRGDAKDAELWNNTMQNLLDQGEAEIDKVVWVMNAAWQRGTASRDKMLQELRRSFGIELYQHLSIVLNFLPHSANKSQYAEELLSQKEKYATWIMSVEDEMFNWSAERRLGVERQVRGLDVYGVSTHPKYYKQKPKGLPLSAPYLSKFPPFSHPAGVEQLFRLFNATRAQKKQGVRGLLVDNPHPRIGPGILQPSFESSCDLCGFYEQADQVLVQGVVGKRLGLRGTELSMDDAAVAVPGWAECGDPDAKGWPASWQKHISRPQNLSSNFAAAHVDLLLPHDTTVDAAASLHKLCFCEAPKCNLPWRFGQGGMQIPALGDCPSPFLEIRPADFGIEENGQNRHSLVRVGSRLIRSGPSLRERDNELLVLDTNSNQMWGLKIAGVKLGRRQSKHSQTAAVLGDTVYMLDSAAAQVLVIDMKSNTTRSIRNSTMFPADVYECIVAHGQDLYLLGAGDQVLSMNVVTASFAVHPLPQERPFSEKAGSWGKWDQAIVVQNKIFAIRRTNRASFILVMRLHNSTFNDIDVGECLGKSPCKFGVAALDGRVYVGPAYSEEILVVDADSESKIASITVRGFGDPSLWRWAGASVLGRKIVFAPLCSDCILMLDVDKHETQCLRIPMIIPSRWSFRYADAVGSSLYLHPFDEPFFLRVDLEVRSTCSV
ncbi:unnamed protein product [Symbiodinium necroappetens]|uniref:G domain-containing protein n=1 Tax=Symbiodinium necroappetens TaxID=1628268 RepID=A0A812SHK2_9DINO|nr:unnamed protein product [Symbiodinium necroappetens]